MSNTETAWRDWTAPTNYEDAYWRDDVLDLLLVAIPSMECDRPDQWAATAGGFRFRWLAAEYGKPTRGFRFRWLAAEDGKPTTITVIVEYDASCEDGEHLRGTMRLVRAEVVRE